MFCTFSTQDESQYQMSVFQAKEQPCISAKAERRGGGGAGKGREAEDLGQGQGHRLQDQLSGQGDPFKELDGQGLSRML